MSWELVWENERTGEAIQRFRIGEGWLYRVYSLVHGELSVQITYVQGYK